jgi:hypothetical protein
VSLIADGLREFIEANQYPYTDVGNDCYRLRFTGKNGEYNMFAQAGENPGLVAVFTYCPVKIPEDRRYVVADYINRVNYGLNLGCLEMDANDGEVRARSSGTVRSDELPPAGLLGPLFDSSFYLIDNWLTGLLRVAFGSDDPGAAYEATLSALRSDQSEAPTAIEEAGGPDRDAEHELTAIEQEVLKLLADRDCQPDSPPPSA